MGRVVRRVGLAGLLSLVAVCARCGRWGWRTHPLRCGRGPA